jgi:hypothetical protein
MSQRFLSVYEWIGSRIFYKKELPRLTLGTPAVPDCLDSGLAVITQQLHLNLCKGESPLSIDVGFGVVVLYRW